VATGRVTLAKAQVQVPEEKGKSLLRIVFEAPADVEWITLFKEGEFPHDLDEPEVIGTTALNFHADVSEVERYAEAIKARVDEANRKFAETVEPRRRREAEQRDATQADVERRREQMQAKLDELF
jgi:hypothetical protein